MSGVAERIHDPAAVLVRAQRPEDAEALVDVHLRSWRWAYRGLVADSYIALLWSQRADRVERTRRMIAEAGPEERFWLTERGGGVVGLAVTSPSRDPDAAPTTSEVGAIYLVPEAAGQGIGRALFAHAVDHLRARGFLRATLWVLDTNARARRFYEAAGWRPDGAMKTEERPGATLHEVRYAIELSPAGLPDTPTQPSIRAIHHVQLAMPAGRETEAEEFYAGLLGIPRVAKPPNLEGRGGCWFRSGTVEIHLGVEQPFAPARKAHPAFLVEDLGTIRERLVEAGVAMAVDEPLAGYERFYADDPFGNRIEFLRAVR